MSQTYNLWDVLVDTGTAVKRDGERTLVVQELPNGRAFDVFHRAGDSGSRKRCIITHEVDAELARLGTDETDWSPTTRTPAEILGMPVDVDEVQEVHGHLLTVMPGFTLPIAAPRAVLVQANIQALYESLIAPGDE